MEGGKKVSLHHFLAAENREFVEKMHFGSFYSIIIISYCLLPDTF